MQIATPTSVTPGATRDYEGNSVQITPYIGEGPFAEHPSGPQAFLVDFKASNGGTIKPHFHPCAQFQVVVSGDGRIGKSPLVPFSVHYADANTPYGPIIPGDGGAIGFFTLRADASSTTFWMPGSRDKMGGRAGRHAVADMRELSGESTDDVTITTLVGPHDDGLAVFGVRMAPGSSGVTPDPSAGGGQFIIVADGDLVADDHHLEPLTTIFVGSDEPGGAEVEAGSAGATLMVCQFPTAA